VIEAILDFIGERRYAHHLIQCEVVTHEGYDVPPETFGIFFGVVATTVREQLADAWTDAFDEAWRTLLYDLDYFVTHPDQKATQGQ
jgi:hypothetical protein